MTGRTTRECHNDRVTPRVLPHDGPPTLNYRCDPTHDFATTFVSGNALRLTGVEATRLTEEPDYRASRIHPEDRGRVGGAMRAVHDDDTRTVDYRFRHDDGEYRWFRDTMCASRDGEGRQGEIVGSVVDVTDLMQTIEQLRQSDRLSRAVIDHMADGVLVVDKDGDFILTNPAAEKLLGLAELARAEEHRLRDDVYTDEDAGERVSPDERPLTKILSGQEVNGAEMFLQGPTRPDGVWLRVNARPLSDEHGPMEAGVATLHDITDRKRAEAAARAREERIRRVADSVPVLVSYVDADRRYRFCNQLYEDWFGLSAEGIQGKPVRDVLGEEAYSRSQPHMDRSLRGERLSFETEIVHRSKGKRHLSVDYVPHVSEGNVLGLYVLGMDITERVEAEAAVRESEAQLRSIMDAAVDGIVTIDERGVINSMNPAAGAMFGYDREELIGSNVTMLMPEPYRGEHHQYLSNYLDTGESRAIGVGREVEGRRKDGTTFPLELSVGEVGLRERRMFTGVLRDVTERRTLQDSLASLNADLEQRVTERTAALEREAEEHRATAELVWQQAEELDQVVRGARCILWRSRVVEVDGSYRWSPMRRHLPVFEEFLPVEIADGEDYHSAWRRSIPAEDRERMDGVGHAALQEGRAEYSVEYRCVDISGRTRWLHDDVSVAPVGDGEWQCVGVLTDVTERKRAEQLQVVLHEVLEAAHTAGSLTNMYRAMHAAVSTLIDATGFAVALVEPGDPDTISFAYWADESGPVEDTSRIHIPRSRTATVARARQTLYMTARQSREYADAGDIDLHGSTAGAWLGAPLVANEELIGVLRLVNHTDPDPYTADDVVTLTYVANQMALAIDRRRTHDELDSERRLFQTLMEHSPDSIYFKDDEGRFTRVSRVSAERMGARDPKEVVGKTDRDFYPKELAETLIDQEAEIFGTGRPLVDHLERYLPEGGEEIWSLISKMPLRDEQGRVTGLVGINRRVTDLVQTQDALREEQRLFKGLMDNIPVLICLKDTESRFLRVNGVCAKALGLASEEDAVGLSDTDIFHAAEARRYRTEEEVVMRTGVPILGRIQADGAGSWVSTTKAPLRDESGEVVGLIAVNRDVSEAMRAQEALRESETQRTQLLEQMIAVQEEERARISRELHDQVGQELTSVLIGLRVIEAADTTEDAAGQAKVLREVTANTLEDVRQIAFDMRPSSLDDLGMETALRRDLELLSRNAGFEATFRSTNPDDLSLPTEMEVGIYRIVHTALTNIVRHADAQRVDVALQTRRVRHGGCSVSVIIQDDGKGFDVDAVLAGPVEGRFGLLSMQERARLMGGEVTVESIVGEGSSVLIEVTKPDWPRSTQTAD